MDILSIKACFKVRLFINERRLHVHKVAKKMMQRGHPRLPVTSYFLLCTRKCSELTKIANISLSSRKLVGYILPQSFQIISPDYPKRCMSCPRPPHFSLNCCLLPDVYTGLVYVHTKYLMTVPCACKCGFYSANLTNQKFKPDFFSNLQGMMGLMGAFY